MVIFVTILQLISALILYLMYEAPASEHAKLAKATKWVGAVFVVLTLVLNCMVAAGL